MQLILESGHTVENPSDDELARLLPAEEFAVLSAGPDSYTYLQFAERKETPWDLLLEYQEGSRKEHFRVVGDGLTMEQIVAAFQKYAKGDASWRSDFQWEKMTLG